MAVIITNTVDQVIQAYNIQNVNVGNAKDNQFSGKISQTTNIDKELYRSSLGTPVLADITFKGGTYTNNDGKTISFGDVKLITVLATVSQSKKIITTEIQGRDGTVKEYIGMGDYEIAVNGIITGDNGHYPDTEIRALKNMLDAPIAISVVSRYLQNLDIYNVVVVDYSFEQEAGGYSKQGFSISCISDVPVELQQS